MSSINGSPGWTISSLDPNSNPDALFKRNEFFKAFNYPYLKDYKEPTEWEKIQNRVQNISDKFKLSQILSTEDKDVRQILFNNYNNSQSQQFRDQLGAISTDNTSINNPLTNQQFDLNQASNSIWSGFVSDNANQLFGDSNLGQLGQFATNAGLSYLNNWSNNKVNATTSNATTSVNGSPNLGTQLKGSGAGLAAGAAVNALGNITGLNDSKGGQVVTGTLSSAASTAASSLASGQNLASAFSNVGSLANVGTGVANIALDVVDPVRKAKWENAANIAAGAAMMIPGVGWGSGAGILAFNAAGHAFGRKAHTITLDEDTFSKSQGSYGSTLDTVQNALADSGAKFSLWNTSGRHKVNKKIDEANRQQNLLSNIINTAEDRRLIRDSMSAFNGINRRYSLQGGYDQGSVHSAKQGAKLELIEIPEYAEVEEVEILWDYEDISKFEKGGKMNIIPEGALHARLHHMDIEGITKKGIPVISEKEGGEIEQQAEIEHSEIILRLSVTEQLEKLMKQEDKDKAAIEAGKLLVKEILYNTDDRVNLLKNE